MLETFELLSFMGVGDRTIFLCMINGVESEKVSVMFKRLDHEGKPINLDRRKLEIEPFIGTQIVLEVGTIFKITLTTAPNTMTITYDPASVEEQTIFNSTEE